MLELIGLEPEQSERTDANKIKVCNYLLLLNKMLLLLLLLF